MTSGQGNNNSRNRQQQQQPTELTEEDGLMREVSLSTTSTSSSGGGGVAARVLRRGGTNNNHTRVTARRQYNRISTGDDEEEEADDEEANNRNSNRGSGGNDSSASVDNNDERRRLRGGAENNNTGIKSAGADEEDDDDDDEKKTVLEEEDGEEDDGRRISVVILDFAQHRFRVSVNPGWSVGTLKRVGCTVHKVSPALQRLIFRGKLLSDDEATLESLGIVEDDVIVHLFPKPRVVIQSSQQQQNSATTGCSAAGADDEDNDADEENGGGAHVPTIVLDAEEAERRSQILVLGAPDYVETQNNVRLFSFMLMIISSIELLNLLAIALGVPQDETNGNENGSEMPSIGLNDDLFAPPSSHHNNNHTANGGGGEYPSSDISLYQEWGPAKYVDLMISSLGVYVAILGLKATTENTRRLATAYLWGVFTTGVCWMMFNYFISLQIDEAVEEERQTEYPDDDVMNPKLSQTDLYYQAATVMILPGMVWILCCIRAYQFQRLLHEAEQEAEERIRQELTNVTGGGGSTTSDETTTAAVGAAETTTGRGNGGGGQQTTTTAGSGRTAEAAVSAAVNHDEELALQNDRERYTIT